MTENQTAPLVTDDGKEFYLLDTWEGHANAERLHEWLIESQGNVFTSLEHISKSGMSRDIVVYTSTGNLANPLRWASPSVSDVLGYGIRRDKYGARKKGIRVQGTGMDMGFHVVYTLSAVLYGDGYALTHRWI